MAGTYTLSPSYLENLSKELKPIVWAFTVTKSDEILSCFTGFTIRDDGLVMTCAHGINDFVEFLSEPSPVQLKGRRLADDDFSYKANIVYVDRSWDLALLKIIDNVSEKVWKSGTFASNGTLAEGQTLLYIGNHESFVGSVLLGRCAYKCVDHVTLPSAHPGQTCANYHCDVLSSKAPEYRILVHVSNSQIIENSHLSKEDLFLNPFVPIIQCHGFQFMDGASGGPVFNTDGEIVGLALMGLCGYEIAIHVSLLKEFMRIGEERLLDPSLPQPAVEKAKVRGPPRQSSTQGDKKKRKT